MKTKYVPIVVLSNRKDHCTWIKLLGADEADWAANGLRDHAEDDGLETGIGVANGDTDPEAPPLVAMAKGLGDDFKRSRSSW